MNAIPKPFLGVRALALLAVSALAAASLRAAPIVIDDFSTDLASTTATQTYLDGPMLGGELDVFTGFLNAATLGIAGGVLTVSGVTETVDPKNAQLVYDGDDGLNTQSYGLPAVDFTDGGANDRFEVDLSSVTGTIEVQVCVWASSGNFSVLQVSTSAGGVLEFPFDDFSNVGSGGDFAAATQVAIFVDLDTGEGFAIDSFVANGPVVPDTIRPGVQMLNTKALKTPSPRHTIRGRATDDVAVARVEVNSRLKKGWRQARLSANGTFRFTASRLRSGKNVHRIRAIDTSGNQSSIRIAKPVGR